MEFKIGYPEFHPTILAWRPEADIHSVRQEFIEEYIALLSILESEGYTFPDFNEGQFVREMIAKLDEFSGVDPQSPKAQGLIEEFYRAAGLREELDRVYGEEPNELIRGIIFKASVSFVSRRVT